VDVRRLVHEAIFQSRLVDSAVSYPARIEAAAGAEPGDEPSGDSRGCSVSLSHVCLFLELEPAVAGGLEPRLRLVVPRPRGLLWGTLADLRGGPAYFTAPPPAFWCWSNRRSAYRVALRQPIRVQVGGAELDAVLVDVSLSGAGLHVPAAPGPEAAVGTRLRLLLPLPGECWADARVVRADPADGGCSLGVAWIDLTPTVDQRLAAFLFAKERETLQRRR
jgi:hypothetical protein